MNIYIYIYKIFVDPNCEKSWSFEFGEFGCLEKKEFFDWEFFESLWNLIFLRYLNKGKLSVTYGWLWISFFFFTCNLVVINLVHSAVSLEYIIRLLQVNLIFYEVLSKVTGKVSSYHVKQNLPQTILCPFMPDWRVFLANFIAERVSLIT